MGLAKFWKRSTQCHKYQATERGPSQHIAAMQQCHVESNRSGAACFKSSIDSILKEESLLPCDILKFYVQTGHVNGRSRAYVPSDSSSFF
jgi:hypothetical protein